MRVPAARGPHPPIASRRAPPSPAVRERVFAPFCRKICWTLTVLSFLLIAGITSAHAVRPDEMLADPALEARAREVSRDLRCLVCRNQSIDDSDADLAHDLRVLVRERIKAGDSDDQVIGFIRARYGEFVLLRPPFTIGTALLWGGPLLVLLFGGLAIARFYRRRDAPTSPLSPEERQRLSEMLGEQANSRGSR